MTIIIKNDAFIICRCTGTCNRERESALSYRNGTSSGRLCAMVL